jgi:hypothetical protein
MSEFVGSDGKAVEIVGVGVAYRRGEYRFPKTMTPDHPDFPAAVEALGGMVEEPFEWKWGTARYRYQNGNVQCESGFGGWVNTEPSTTAFNAGRRYERERGD